MTETIIRHNGWSEYWDGESAQWVPVQDNAAPKEITSAPNNINALGHKMPAEEITQRPVTQAMMDRWVSREIDIGGFSTQRLQSAGLGPVIQETKPATEQSDATEGNHSKRPWFCHDGWTNR
jgi:hypothetical protein